MGPALDHPPLMPPSGEFARPALPAAIERARLALEARNIRVLVVDDAEAARAAVVAAIAPGARVMNATSTTMDAIGATNEILESGRFRPVRKDIATLPAERKGEARLLTAHPDWVTGSVHAVTEQGEVLVASQSGSQLALYAYTGAHVLWVVGAQKVVPDFATALRRVHEHALPLEDARARTAYGKGSNVGFLLVVEHPPVPGRATMVIVRQALGF